MPPVWVEGEHLVLGEGAPLALEEVGHAEHRRAPGPQGFGGLLVLRRDRLLPVVEVDQEAVLGVLDHEQPAKAIRNLGVELDLDRGLEGPPPRLLALDHPREPEGAQAVPLGHQDFVLRRPRPRSSAEAIPGLVERSVRWRVADPEPEVLVGEGPEHHGPLPDGPLVEGPQGSLGSSEPEQEICLADPQPRGPGVRLEEGLDPGNQSARREGSVQLSPEHVCQGSLLPLSAPDAIGQPGSSRPSERSPLPRSLVVPDRQGPLGERLCGCCVAEVGAGLQLVGANPLHRARARRHRRWSTRDNHRSRRGCPRRQGRGRGGLQGRDGLGQGAVVHGHQDHGRPCSREEEQGQEEQAQLPERDAPLGSRVGRDPSVRVCRGCRDEALEGLAEIARAGVARVGLEGAGSLTDSSQLAGNVGRDGLERTIVAGPNRARDLIEVGPGKGPLRGQALVEQEADAIDVALLARRASVEGLGGEVIRRPDHEPLAREAARGHVLGEAEVGQEGLAARLEEDVVGLDVSVQDARPVRVVEALADLDHQASGLFGREGARDLEPVLERAALDVVQGEVEQAPLGVSSEVTAADHVGVLELTRELGLLLEAGLADLVGSRQEDLERDLAPQPLALGEEHRAERAAPELAQDLIGANLFERHVLLGVWHPRGEIASGPTPGESRQEALVGAAPGWLRSTQSARS